MIQNEHTQLIIEYCFEYEQNFATIQNFFQRFIFSNAK